METIDVRQYLPWMRRACRSMRALAIIQELEEHMHANATALAQLKELRQLINKET